MEFLQSGWFMWAVIIVVIGSIIAIFSESFSDFDDWDLVWHGIKKGILFILGMILLPLVIIFGRTKERKDPRH